MDKILNSKHLKKVVVAGPGTGKTYLFKKILEGKSNTLTLSFINALVEDLALELYGLSEVRTLHSYARSALASLTKKNVELFPKLAHVIRQDAQVLLTVDIDFDPLLFNRKDDDEKLRFYSERRKYYDRFGYTDIIFAAVKFFELHRDRVPAYEQIVVDEFQDFNLLEVSLIELLAEKSPIVLAGDDDQALYDFKSASAEHIRGYHSGKDSPYAPFSLPYCARCTRVIIDAANDVIGAAKKQGLLKGRIEKPYRYFDCREKDAESAKYQRLEYRQVFAKQIPWVIATDVNSIAEELCSGFSILIIAATTTQCRSLAKTLRKKGFENVFLTKREDPEPTLLDGLTILLEDNESNLGWRIVARSLLKESNFNEALISAGVEKPFGECVDNETRTRVASLLKKLRQHKAGSLDREELLTLFDELAIDALKESKEWLKDVLEGIRPVAKVAGLSLESAK